MTNQKHIKCFLSNEQIYELVMFVIDQFGIDLSGDELTESIYLALEDVPGIEGECLASITLSGLATIMMAG